PTVSRRRYRAASWPPILPDGAPAPDETRGHERARSATPALLADSIRPPRWYPADHSTTSSDPPTDSSAPQPPRSVSPPTEPPCRGRRQFGALPVLQPTGQPSAGRPPVRSHN